MGKLLKNIGIVAASVGTTVVILTWNGGEVLKSAEGFITNAVATSNSFKDNETKLIEKINTLRGERETIQNYLDKLTESNEYSKTEIITLNEKISELDVEIKTITNQLEVSDTEKVRLENELVKANNDAEELKAVLESSHMVEPNQSAVDSALDGNLDYEEIKINSSKAIVSLSELIIDYHGSNDTGSIGVRNLTGKPFSFYLNEELITVEADDHKIYSVNIGTTVKIGTSMKYIFVK